MSGATPPPEPRLAALRYRDFRLLWTGQLISTVGSQMQMIAVNWQLYQLLSGTTYRIALFNVHLALSAQALGLGALGLVRVIPIVVLALPAGVLADTGDRRRLILWSQSVECLVAAFLAVLSLTGHAGIVVLYALTAAGTAAATFEDPASSALAPQLVARKHFLSAASLGSLNWTSATIAGPALAGVVVGIFPLGVVYALNAVSFLAVLGAVAALRHRDTPHPEGTRLSWHAVLEGLRFTRSTPVVWGTMLLDFWATFFSSARTMLPIVAGSLLHVSVLGYGILATAQPIGAVSTGMVLALRRGLERQGTLLVGGVLVYGAATALFGLSTIFALSYLLFFLTGAGDMVSTVIRANMRQLLTPNELRGRLNSVHMIMAMGGPQLGEVEAGVVAALCGVSFAIVTGGVVTVMIAGWVAWRFPGLRRYHGESTL
jgi:MFS family permease